MLSAALAKETEKLLACVHCGLCLPACPTYRQLGNENDSPRGRLYLMRAVAEGKLEITPAYDKHIDLCLGCRACETACPSGVPFGHLLEAARAEIAESKPVGIGVAARLKRSLAAFVLNRIFTSRKKLALAWTMARLIQKSGIATLALQARLFSFAPQIEFGLALFEQARSRLDEARKFAGNGERVGNGERRTANGVRRISQFMGCIMEGLFTETNRATARALEANGCEIERPESQVCCGALHAHSGLRAAAVKLAKANIDAFSSVKDDSPIIANASGCGAMLKEYGELLADDPQYAERARRFSERVKDSAEFLAACREYAHERTSINAVITYDAPCHLYHGQGVRQQPLDLLKSIPGAVFVPLNGAEQCCGSAGIYNVTHYEMADKLLAEKVENIKKTKAKILVTGNPGCAMHIGAGLRLAGENIVVLHPMELLDLSYELPQKTQTL